MSSARRPLLTAAAAGGLLCALWFVPSANATPETAADEAVSASPSPLVTEQARIASTGTDAAEVRLADTGSFDSTPYVIGGVLCLGLGAGFVTYSVRRERLDY
ncbi:LPXTG cell wall anchor domain-containing protein [Streptomyces tagetis]|uniref:LPXTG cell wall anchor domain-containing protein n=1 Tax=Streptomyces tagetis TaxID=2820809 RepID=A0A940XDT7_9ACTN|nr:LPXTG cell wall anchor domain-containing protein [Streptomyces sp. RG38]MBQ0828483.1 LPXTG cell wall anchor domain-containing protein [Streptomyces sp. RG38]